jgi:hypothetical protein
MDTSTGWPSEVSVSSSPSNAHRLTGVGLGVGDGDGDGVGRADFVGDDVGAVGVATGVASPNPTANATRTPMTIAPTAMPPTIRVRRESGGVVRWGDTQ